MHFDLSVRSTVSQFCSLNMKPGMMVDKCRMNPDGAGNEVPAEQNHNLREENKEIGEWSGGEEQRGSEEGESRINDAAEDVRDDAALPGEQLVLLQRQRQQPPPPPILGAVVRWERLLPVRSLNVLLVENDDSTRQLVCALLRNCSYEVTAVADGIQAWNLLEAMEQRIHLVLTEVIMPCLSGIGLLSKIMSHRSCKHIPVIMMSSNDSMAMVLRCLSKGAVDFLVKPIRKNELKNLWQHVWRRCHSSSGSRSESGVQNQKTIKSKNTDDSDNNTGSNDEEDNGSFGLNFRDGSDHGSGTQSSWTKRAVEDGSPQLISTSNQLADPQDSTCAQDIYPKFDVFFNKSVPSISRECQEPKEFSDKNFIGEDLEMSLYSNPDGKHVNNTSEKVYAAPRGPRMDKLPGCIRKTDIDDCVPGLDSSNASCGPTAKVADLIGDMTTNSDTQMGSRVTEIADGFTKTLKCKDKFPEDLRESPSLELSLKRSRSLGDGDDHNVLGHSDLSAFSRYNNSAASTHPSRGYVGSCSSPHDLSDAKAECRVLHTSTSKQGSHGSGSNNDKGSTTKDVLTKLVPSKEKMVSSSSIKNVHPLALHPVSHVPSTMQPIMQENVDDASLAGISGQPRTVQHQVQVQHHHHHYHHHHYHVHGMEQQRPQADHDDMAFKNMATTAPQCGSSNVPPGPLQGNAANYSLNGSGSGSNEGSNGPNGSSIAVDARGMNLENDTGVAATCEAGGGPSGVDQNRVSQREVALNKFRLKRKERNFEKKVRYQSRKRLAEQRPRVRGQFVRRTTSPDSGS